MAAEPPFLSIADLTRAMGEEPTHASRQRVLRMLRRIEKCTGEVLFKIGARWGTTAERLRRACPDMGAWAERARAQKGT